MRDVSLTREAVNAAIRSGKEWAAFGPCRDEDPDLFFPNGHEGGWLHVIAVAKAVCGRCPVVEHCLQHAMDNNIEYGIWGGLTEKERRSLKRRNARIAAVREDIAEMRQPETLFDAWEARTRPLAGGHLGWSGSNKLHFQGVSYTPNQAAFIATRGRKPYGQVLSTCGVPSCLLPEHLTDGMERAEQQAEKAAAGRARVAACGTNSGYAKHLRDKTPTCDPCRTAHAEADRRLRTTGSSAQAVG